MKYIIGLLLVVLVARGIFSGYRAGVNKGQNNSQSSTSKQDSSRSSQDAKVVDLSNTGLAKVTSNIYNNTTTTDLILSNNSIQTLPSEMGKMTNLVVFKINQNKLDGSLIGEIRKMTKLRVLDVSNNNMAGMPAEIGRLRNLETLNYSNNRITGLPNELANLKNNLKEFNLSGNPLNTEQINTLKTELPTTNIIF